jgi:hypothetical protein
MSLYNTFSFFSFWKHFIFTTCCSLAALRRNAARKQGSRGRSHEEQREGQELDNRMCCHHIKSEPRTQTFRLHTRPSPLSVAEWVKLSPHWSCGETTTSDFVGLFGLFSCVLTQVHISSCYMKTSVGSFETPSCFRDVYTLHQVASSGRSNSDVTQDHIGVCNMKTNINKKAREHNE